MAAVRHLFKSVMALNGVLIVMKKNALLSNARYNKPSFSLHDIRTQPLGKMSLLSAVRCGYVYLMFLAQFNNVWKTRMVDGFGSPFQSLRGLIGQLLA
ncbi:hypothetical protein XB02_19550 [Pantoea ananatis]|nr:hypothetical protein XB02_19550 [Pantoea ananatis]